MREALPVSKRRLGVFAALSLLWMLAMVSISAGAQETRLKVNIPFNFNIEKTALPAGEYIVEKATFPGIFLIRNVDGHYSAVTYASYAVGALDQERAQFVFNRYGDQYFLSVVWSEGTFGQELRKSRREREVNAAWVPATAWPSASRKIVILPLP